MIPTAMNLVSEGQRRCFEDVKNKTQSIVIATRWVKWTVPSLLVSSFQYSALALNSHRFWLLSIWLKQLWLWAEPTTLSAVSLQTRTWCTFSRTLFQFESRFSTPELRSNANELSWRWPSLKTTSYLLKSTRYAPLKCVRRLRASWPLSCERSTNSRIGWTR